MKNRKILLACGLLAISLSTAGCLTSEEFSRFQEKRFRQAYEDAPDKPMIDAFFAKPVEGSRINLRPEFAAAEIYMVPLLASRISMQETIRSPADLAAARKYFRSYEPVGEGDLIASRFVETAKKRGNLVRLYQPALGGKLNDIFAQPFTHTPQRIYTLDRENALIEWTTDGRPVSILLRSLQAVESIGVNIYRFTSIYTGPLNIRHFENTISRKIVEEHYMRTL